jgi:glucosamine-6-phosphate deaminase
MSPGEVEEKHQAILRHQSQKDKPMFPGEDDREFWQRVKERNRGTAELINRLGFPEY